MERLLSTSFSAASLMVAVGASALWVRSHHADYERRLVGPVCGRNTYVLLMSHAGGFRVKVTPDWPTGESGEAEASWASCREFEGWEHLFGHAGADHRGCGLVGVVTGTDELFGFAGECVTLPGVAVVGHYGLVVLASALLPARSLLRWGLRRRRLGRHLCVRCGYDLRASLGRCPECGSAFAPARPHPVRPVYRVGHGRRDFTGGHQTRQ